MDASISHRSTTLACALVLLAAPLAGCIGTFEGDGAFGSFEEARGMAFDSFTPEQDVDLRLGLIEPAQATGVEQGKQNVTFVLWDESTDEPVEDASFTIEAFMPMMGHGTSPEEDPEHLRHGVYRGSTNLMMGGTWIVHLNGTLADGQEAHFPLEIGVAEGGHDDGHGDHDHDHGGHNMSSGYGSYEEAREAEGESFEPEEESPIRLKLLDPAREGIPQGETDVEILLYDSEADEPVTSADAYLNATMPEMGHGTDPEKDPMHTEHGVWKGMTTLTMEGTWILGFDVRPEDGDWLTWEVNVTVGNQTQDNGTEEPPFEPYERVIEDEVASPNYNQSYELEVKGPEADITMDAFFGNATPVTDEITIELLDPEGQQAASLTLNADTSESSATVQEAPGGDYSVRVHGQALDADYRVTLTIAPPG